MIDDDEADVERCHRSSDLIHFAAAEQRCRPEALERHEPPVGHVEVDRLREADGLSEAFFRRVLGGGASVGRPARGHRHQDECTGPHLGERLFQPRRPSLTDLRVVAGLVADGSNPGFRSARRP